MIQQAIIGERALAVLRADTTASVRGWFDTPEARDLVEEMQMLTTISRRFEERGSSAYATLGQLERVTGIGERSRYVAGPNTVVGELLSELEQIRDNTIDRAHVAECRRQGWTRDCDEADVFADELDNAAPCVAAAISAVSLKIAERTA